VTDWPAGHKVPAGATTAALVFPAKLGVDAPRVLARPADRRAQEAAMVKEIIAEVEKYNTTVPKEKQLSMYKAFEGSEADVIICRRDAEIFLPDGKTLDITSEEAIWVGLQVKTGSIISQYQRTKNTKILRFNSVNGYKDLIALVCLSMDDRDEVFYFDEAPEVGAFSSAVNLDIPVKPVQKHKIASIRQLRLNHQINFADLPTKLFKLFDRHAKAGTLMSWREANAPAAKGESNDLKVTLLRSSPFPLLPLFLFVLTLTLETGLALLCLMCYDSHHHCPALLFS